MVSPALIFKIKPSNLDGPPGGTRPTTTAVPRNGNGPLLAAGCGPIRA